MENSRKKIPKKYARIFFNINSKGEICEFEIHEFNKENKNYILDVVHKRFTRWIGNGERDWNERTFSDLLIQFFAFYGAEKKLKIKIINELLKINGFEFYGSSDPIAEFKNIIWPT